MPGYITPKDYLPTHLDKSPIVTQRSVSTSLKRKFENGTHTPDPNRPMGVTSGDFLKAVIPFVWGG